ncbi:MAG TPA: cupredoxin domain-containing protein [Candidatus Limnocylindrales bacterium]|nr:cupredoxin domain-containing protein [Candidatus Limnocylindrales bacterium]
MNHRFATAATAIALVITLAACSGSAASSAPLPSAPAAPSAPSASPSTATAGAAITVKDFTLDPTDVRVQGAVSLAVTNAGPTVHNVAIRDAAGAVVGTTKDLKTGESETITPALAAGTYTLFCSLAGHESLGIKGTLTVE